MPAGIHKKILGSGNATLIIIVKLLENFGLLLKGVGETIQNETKEQKGGFLSMLLGTLGTSLLGNILAGKGAIVKNHGRRMNRAGEGAIAKRQG